MGIVGMDEGGGGEADGGEVIELSWLPSDSEPPELPSGQMDDYEMDDYEMDDYESSNSFVTPRISYEAVVFLAEGVKELIERRDQDELWASKAAVLRALRRDVSSVCGRFVENVGKEDRGLIINLVFLRDLLGSALIEVGEGNDSKINIANSIETEELQFNWS